MIRTEKNVEDSPNGGILDFLILLTYVQSTLHTKIKYTGLTHEN